MVVAGANSAGSGDPRTTANTSMRCCGRSPDRATAFDRYGLTVRAIEAAGRETCGRGLVRGQETRAQQGEPRTTAVFQVQLIPVS